LRKARQHLPRFLFEGSELRKLVLLLGALIVLFGLFIAPFVIFAKIADGEIARRGLTEADHNSLKHALAASELYAHLQPVLGADNAADLTVLIGELVERLEQYTKHETDVAREVYKDLRNNLYGVIAARWMEDAGGSDDYQSRLRLIGWLAETDALADWAEDKRVPDTLPWTPDIDAAVAAADADRSRLEQEFRAHLMANRQEIAADLALAAK
jgi:hypothetical protein